MDSWKTKYVFPALGMIPIDRPGGDKSASALDTAAGVLQRGELFGIFPEGTRIRDGVLHTGRTGAARLSLEIGCPIYPVGIVGTDAIQPSGAKAHKPFKRARSRSDARSARRATATGASCASRGARSPTSSPQQDRTGVQ
jgi:1-acyl-sn-glycerol-3-phosphate acyltransferase